MCGEFPLCGSCGSCGGPTFGEVVGEPTGAEIALFVDLPAPVKMGMKASEARFDLCWLKRAVLRGLESFFKQADLKAQCTFDEVLKAVRLGG